LRTDLRKRCRERVLCLELSGSVWKNWRGVRDSKGPEAKQLNKQWAHANSPNCPWREEVVEQSFFARVLVCTRFFARFLATVWQRRFPHNSTDSVGFGRSGILRTTVGTGGCGDRRATNSSISRFDLPAACDATSRWFSPVSSGTSKRKPGEVHLPRADRLDDGRQAPRGARHRDPRPACEFIARVARPFRGLLRGQARVSAGSSESTDLAWPQRERAIA